MRPRTDLATNFRSATMRWNPDLMQSLSSKQKQEVRESEPYLSISEQIKHVSRQISDIQKTTDPCPQLAQQLSDLDNERGRLYRERNRLLDTKLKDVQRNQKICYDGDSRTRAGARELHRIRHMLPQERLDLAELMPIKAPSRSAEWIAALHNLVALRTADTSVAYQPGLRPEGGHCKYCCKSMDEYVPSFLQQW